MKGDKNQVITNIPIANCGTNYKGCWRLQKAHKMLDGRPVSKEYLKKTLASVAQKDVVSTLISRVIDLKTREITIYYKRKFKNSIVIKLDDELKKGLSFYCLPTLFNLKTTNCSLTAKNSCYLDENWKELPSEKKAKFFREIAKDSASSKLTIKEYHLKSNIVLFEAVYSNNEAICLDIKNGTFTWRYENGNRSCEGDYLDNKRNGKWSYWAVDGELIKVVIFDNNEIKKEEYFTADETKKKLYNTVY